MGEATQPEFDVGGTLAAATHARTLERRAGGGQAVMTMEWVAVSVCLLVAAIAVSMPVAVR